MPAEAAPPSPTSSASPAREEVDRLLLPPLRARVRDSLWFLALSQSIYLVTLVFSQGEAVWERAGLNVVRLAILFACIHQLRGEGTRRHTLTWEAIGLGVQLGVGVAISVVRRDALPMALLTIALTSVTSVYIPWGPWAQAALAAASALSLLVASALVYQVTGTHLGFDPAATLFTTFIITVYIARFIDRSQKQLETRLREAREADDELAVLRAQLEKRVAERTAELEMANRELEGFSYTVSHDLRSPLRTIAGFSQVILDESAASLDEPARANLGKIHAASRRMDGLIDDMLRLARVGRSALRYETVNLTTLARQIGEDLTAEYPDRKVVLTVEPIPPVPGDHALLKIALDNLMRNAWKFTGTRDVGHVTVSGEYAGGIVVCRVADDGIGFDPRFRGKLFQPFERIHSDPRFPGTGVGLATVARIVRRHGGEVDATGVIDGGALFSISLPIARPQ